MHILNKTFALFHLASPFSPHPAAAERQPPAFAPSFAAAARHMERRAVAHSSPRREREREREGWSLDKTDRQRQTETDRDGRWTRRPGAASTWAGALRRHLAPSWPPAAPPRPARQRRCPPGHLPVPGGSRMPHCFPVAVTFRLACSGPPRASAAERQPSAFAPSSAAAARRGGAGGRLQAQRAGRRGATWATCTPIALAHQDGSQQSATAFGFSWQQCHCSASQSPQDRVVLLCLERQPPSKAHDHAQDGVEGAPGTALAP